MKFKSSLMILAVLLGVNVCYADGISHPTVSAFINDDHEDRAGVWNVFETGPGKINPSSEDWHWTLKLNLNEQKQIKSITVIHNIQGEAWSTSSKKMFNKGLYPLVVIYHGRQLNNHYDDPLGQYWAGDETFELYGQKEAEPFSGATLMIVFTDDAWIQTT